jgi:hypothetical protein
MGQSYKRWAWPALIAGWVVFAGGCAAPTNNTPAAAPATAAPGNKAPTAAPARPPQRPAVSDKRFIIAPELLGILHVVSVSLANPPGSYLKIQVNVQNMTDAPQQFRYRIDWFDQDGGRLPVGADDFIPWMLLPREVSSIAVTAPAPMAADFGIAFVPNSK